MVISKTPFRMSFFGGGTDFPNYYQKYGGAVLSTTIDKYCYVTVRHLPPFFEHRNEIVYSQTEWTNTVNEIRHPAVRNAMQYLNMRDLHISYDADLPARTGLGTSSSFAVGMLNAFYALKGKRMDKRKLADDAIYLERELCGELGGIQDQIAASFGGLNRIDFNEFGYQVQPIILSNERKKALNNNLMLFYTGISRYSSVIQENTQKSILKKVEQLKQMRSLVDIAENILTDKKNNLDEIGRLLDYTWRLKRDISSGISTDSIDGIYQKAQAAGALGGKLLGAGGGGFLLFYVEPDKQKNVSKVLEDLLYIPFEFEQAGAQILYYRAEEYKMED